MKAKMQMLQRKLITEILGLQIDNQLNLENHISDNTKIKFNALYNVSSLTASAKLSDSSLCILSQSCNLVLFSGKFKNQNSYIKYSLWRRK
jgi:hypothetical protein